MVIPPDKLLPVGSVVEIPLDSGRHAYAQNLENGHPAPIVRVLPGLFEDPLPLEEIEHVAESDDTQFLVQFSLMLLVDSRRGRVVTRQAPPERLCRRPPLRQFVRPSAVNPSGWYVVDADASIEPRPSSRRSIPRSISVTSQCGAFRERASSCG